MSQLDFENPVHEPPFAPTHSLLGESFCFGVPIKVREHALAGAASYGVFLIKVPSSHLLSRLNTCTVCKMIRSSRQRERAACAVSMLWASRY